MMSSMKAALHGMVPLTIYLLDLGTDLLTTREYCYANYEDDTFTILNYCYLSISLLLGPSIVLNTILIYIFWLESWSKRCWVRVLLVMAWFLQLLPAFSLVRHVVKLVTGSENVHLIPGNAQMVRSTVTFLADIPQISLQTYIMAKLLTRFEYDLVTPMKIASIIISLISIALNMGRFYCRVRQVDRLWGKVLIYTTIFTTTGCRLSVCALAAATITSSYWFLPIGLAIIFVFVVTYAKIRLSRSGQQLVNPARLLEDMFYAAVLQSVLSVAGIYSSIAFIASAILIYTNHPKTITSLTVLVMTVLCQVLASTVDALLHHRGIYKQEDIPFERNDSSRDSHVEREERYATPEVNAERYTVQGEDNLTIVMDVVSSEHIDASSRNSLPTVVATSPLETMSSLPSSDISHTQHNEIADTPISLYSEAPS